MTFVSAEVAAGSNPTTSQQKRARFQSTNRQEVFETSDLQHNDPRTGDESSSQQPTTQNGADDAADVDDHDHHDHHDQLLFQRHRRKSVSTRFTFSESTRSTILTIAGSSHGGLAEKNASGELPSHHRHHQRQKRHRQKMRRHEQQKRRRSLSIISRFTRNGGDIATRLDMALRTTIGTVINFACFRHEFFHGVWIANMFFHVCLADPTIGASSLAFQKFAFSVIITTLLSWPIAIWFESGALSMMTRQILLPIFIFFLSLLFMLCPWLSYRNLMVLISYIVIALPVRNTNLDWYGPWGYCASYVACTCVAVLMTIPNRACNRISVLLHHYESDACQCLTEIRAYTMSAGHASKVARAAISGIQLLVGRMDTTVRELKRLTPAASEELRLQQWMGGGTRIRWRRQGQKRCQPQSVVARLEHWIQHLERQIMDYHLLTTALGQHYLGEASPLQSQDAVRMRILIAKHISPMYQHLIDHMAHAIQLGTLMADPIACHADDPDDVTVMTELCKEIEVAFSNAIQEAAMTVGSNVNAQPGQQKVKPQLAHLARRMATFRSFMSIADNLITYLKDENDAKDQNMNHERATVVPAGHTAATTAATTAGTNSRVRDGRMTRICCLPFRIIANMLQYLIREFWTPSWLWRNEADRNLAFKMAAGMCISSLFVSVDALWKVAAPFGLWPAITVAIVNLGQRGSSFQKASDRLFGTAFAVAFGMLVVDVFPNQDEDTVHICAIGVFTFVMIYLRNPEHAYMYTYAAMSIGAILIGATENGYDVEEYIPKRIQLIFVGVFIFASVELFLFPRSSRNVVETMSLSVLFQCESFLGEGKSFLEQLEHDVAAHHVDVETGEHISTQRDGAATSDRDDPRTIEMEKEAQQRHQINAADSPSKTKLEELQQSIHSCASSLAQEVPSALKEPYFGFSQRLIPAPIINISREATLLDRQTTLLMKAFTRIPALYSNQVWNSPSHTHAYSFSQKHNSSRNGVAAGTGAESGVAGTTAAILAEERRDWPKVYHQMISMASQQIQKCCDNLRVAFPDGRLRPQHGNSLDAVAAAASFKEMNSIRLQLVDMWSRSFYEMQGYHLERAGGDRAKAIESMNPTQVVTLGVTISYLLEICRHCHQIGENLEAYARSFPR